MATMHYSVDCPKCDARNFVDCGDPNDLTVGDVLGCRCWKCEHEFPLDDDIPDDEWPDAVEDGTETP